VNIKYWRKLWAYFWPSSIPLYILTSNIPAWISHVHILFLIDTAEFDHSFGFITQRTGYHYLREKYIEFV
jgi:hypothetical protein